MSIRLLIADDEPDIRGALAELFAADAEVDVVALAGTTEETVALAAQHAPDVVLMDVKMPGGGGPTATRLIRQRQGDTQVVALSAYQDRATVLEMLRAGAVGYVTKGSSAAELTTAIHRAAEGLGMLSPAATAEIVHELGARLRDEEAAAAARTQRIGRIERAIAGDLRMVFQPIVDLRTGLLAGVEALARFNGDPQRTPDVWFAEAGEVGLRLPLERAACDAAVAALDRLPDELYLSLNLSPDVVVAHDFWTDLPPAVVRRLVVELTEHAVVHDYEQLRQGLAPLRAQGGRLAVDDAGDGFASLRHILLLDPDFIKIDASLTQNLDHDPARGALAAALASFAAETGATMVAEGIERDDDLVALQRLGAAYGQGYLLGRPAELDALDLTRRQLPRSGTGAPVSHALPPSPPYELADQPRDDRPCPPPEPAGGNTTASASENSSRPARGPDAAGLVDRLLRRLLRVTTPEQAVAELFGFVHDLGGRTIPASAAAADALPVDLGFGVLPEPVLPAAASDSPARQALEAELPLLVEDVRAVVTRLQTASQAAREATVDPLTGLLNRRGAGRVVGSAGPGDAVAMLDLDHFKALNDTHGHDAGDAVLRAFSDTLRHAVRESDVCSRYGGEEFLLVLPGTSVDGAVHVIERVAAHWREQRPLPVTFSAGVAAFDDRGLEAAIAAADAALYDAKRSGRDRIETVPREAPAAPAP